jgi:hypothetical protein
LAVCWLFVGWGADPQKLVILRVYRYIREICRFVDCFSLSPVFSLVFGITLNILKRSLFLLSGSQQANIAPDVTEIPCGAGDLSDISPAYNPPTTQPTANI